MSATIKDVARLAGVSIKTVSNVLNDYPHLTLETKGKVERALAELDYRPNLAARNLRRGRTGMIALALPTFVSPYFAELADLIAREAAGHDLTVLIEATDGDLQRERNVAEGFHSRFLDGVILQPWSVSDRFLRARTDQTPLVLLGEGRVRTADGVAVDSRAVATAAVDQLLGLGRRRIGVIGSPQQGAAGRQRLEPTRRYAGYRAALEAAGLAYDETLISTVDGDHTPERTADAVADLLARVADVDAIFCFNDRLGVATIRALTSRGVRVPDDVAVIGIDDIEAARTITPTLSTIAPDKAEIARAAVRMLTERIGGATEPARHVTAGFTVITRESTGADQST